MEVKKLPARPNLEQYRKQAKDLLKAIQAADRSALRRMQAAQRSPAKEVPMGISLADAQLVIAREYGFASWPRFADHIRALTSRDSTICHFELAIDAIITGNMDALERLLQETPDLIRARSSRIHRATLLHYTAANGVENFLQKTPKNIVAVAEFLLRSGAEVDATADMYGGGATTLGLVVTSLHPFLAGVQNDLADVLLQYGADINRPQGAGNGQPPINGCLANGRPEAAEHLANRGAHLDLEAAAGVGRLDIVKNFFNAQGALKDATETELKSGFKWACAYGRIEVVEYLLRANLDVNAVHRGETPLHWAAYSGNVQIVRLLLGHQARVDLDDETFHGTPLGWALYGWGEARKNERSERYYEVAELLVDAGGTVDPQWLNERDRGLPLDTMIAGDPKMSKLLGSSARER